MKKIIGALCVLAGLQFLLVMISLESIVSGFDRTINFISDLGVGSTALLFNTSIFIAGVVSIIVAFYLFFFLKKRALSIILIRAGLSVALVGVFPENIYPTHLQVSFLAFLFGGLTALISSFYSKKPWSYVFLFLGLIALSVLATDAILWYGFGTILPLGAGLIERLIVYPFILWGMLFGFYLIVEKENAKVNLVEKS